ncbi:MAG: EamA family transporter [archaeon]
MIWIYLLLLLAVVLLGIVAQIFLKMGVNKAGILHFKEETLFSLATKFILSKHIWIGGFLYALSTLLWIVILTKLDLSFAYPVISSNYFFVALISKFYFHDQVTWKRWLSIFTIIIGIIILALGSF